MSNLSIKGQLNARATLMLRDCVWHELASLESRKRPVPKELRKQYEEHTDCLRALAACLNLAVENKQKLHFE